MGFSSLQSLVCRRVRGVSVPAVRGGSVVSDGVARFTHQPSPTACAMGSSSRASCPLRSVFACAPAPPLSVRRVLPWGSLPSSRRYRWSPHLAGLPGPASFRPQVFSTSRRLAPPPASRACFIPLPRPGFPFRGLVSRRSRADSSPAMPPCPSPSPRSPVARLPRHAGWTSRLCSAIRCDRRGRFLPFRAAAPLFGFSSSRLSRPPLPGCPGAAHDLAAGIFVARLTFAKHATLAPTWAFSV